ncbi:hypothetical protein C1646_759112 [Rhizophagus diaphanus]|nr:hypothetical protein C1646_759112 [Rhizophagus diaphanus] [Rhizophagus sp. MUCL 43196]
MIISDGLGLELQNDLDGLNFEKDACLELNFDLGYKGKLEETWAIKVIPFLTWILAWAIKERPPEFGFHKGDVLPIPWIFGRTSLEPGFWQFGMNYKGRHLLRPGL